MRLRFLFAFAVLALSGCLDFGGSGQSYIPSTPQPPPSPYQPGPSHKRHAGSVPAFVYVTDRAAKQLLVYPFGVNNPQPIRSVSIPEAPLGVAVNPVNGNVYVSCYQDVVEIYNSGATQNVGQITAQVNEPGGIALDSSGNLYAVNRGTASTITEIAPDGKSVIRVISAVPNVQFVGGVAVNSDGTVFASVLVIGQTFWLAEVYPGYQTIGVTGGAGGVATDEGNDIIAGALSVVQTYSPLFKRTRWQNFSPDEGVMLLTHNLEATAIPFENPNDGRTPVVYVEADNASQTFAIDLPGTEPGGAAVGP